MTRRKETAGIGKARKNQPKPDPLPGAKKSFRSPLKPESRISDIDFSKNTWTVKMAAAWAGIPERTLYKLLRAGVLPCIAMGDLQEQKLPAARSGKRVRRCYRFVIPATAFRRAWENLSSASGVGNSAA
jgi:hypothetical protein